jgi:hypothetical protein
MCSSCTHSWLFSALPCVWTSKQWVPPSQSPWCCCWDDSSHSTNSPWTPDTLPALCHLVLLTNRILISLIRIYSLERLGYSPKVISLGHINTLRAQNQGWLIQELTDLTIISHCLFLPRRNFSWVILYGRYYMVFILLFMYIHKYIYLLYFIHSANICCFFVLFFETRSCHVTQPGLEPKLASN